ncbi:hypothetical protein AAWM_11193 [Aspergillus awamori]|uniref:Uncharacterized protein n=1 Tax=Aspergillus awamori TaxID=105351 RepID=A0A401L9W8_ASPAW|nr:hypothetical protein AAWM_11193 [Aspergillus awamori]GKZ63589.1 hypothetical protein AnigIFM49718_001213 [Aspergillus niger]GLA10224.1 hypothetical protein AnigIFM60653_002101 [Aspergillus niger]GLA21755.1 hypothetical protein AnigIFM62618_000982 [Aspergillus niger]GLA44556.1 hypothetical protein AnigIFM63309_003778 [Aspergillus niger]
MPLSAIWTRRAANEAASSIYSREHEVAPVPPLSILRKGRSPTDSPARHDLPEINLIDHQIALARGTTMALETTRVRIRNAKKNGPRSLRDTLEEKWRQWKRQEDENRFFRTCLRIFDDLAAVAGEVSDDLILQHEFEPEVSPVGNRRILLVMRKLQEALSDSHRKEARAREKWDRRLNLPDIHAPVPQWI